MSLSGAKKWGSVSNCVCQPLTLLVATGSICRKPTSRVKSPDSPHEVVAVGAGVVDVEDTATSICVLWIALELVVSDDSGVLFDVTMSVSDVGAGRMIQLDGRA